MSLSDRESVHLSPIYIGGTVGQFTSPAVRHYWDSSGQMGQIAGFPPYLAHRNMEDGSGTGGPFGGDEKLCKKSNCPPKTGQFVGRQIRPSKIWPGGAGSQ